MTEDFKITSNEKWKLFKNFMHNDLGITKDDIRVWLHEAIQQQAKLMVAQTFKDFDMKQEVRNLVLDYNYAGNSFFKNEIKSLVAKELATRIEMKVGNES